jgi:hypothetical protein
LIGQVPVRNLPDRDLEVFCCVRFVVVTQRCVVGIKYVGAGLDRVGEVNKAIAERQVRFAVFAAFLEDRLVVMLDWNIREA